MSRRKAPNAPKREQPAPPAMYPGAPLPVILDALARAGWGPFAGRYWAATRAILTACGALLGASGQGYVTAGQIADAAGYSELWTRRKLHELEDAGVLTWDRGTIVDGRPAPGWIRVSKTALSDAVNRAREVGTPKALARARDTAARIAAAGLRWTKRGLSRRRGRPTETQTGPSPLRRETGGREPARPVTHSTLSGPRPPVGERFGQVLAAMAHQQPPQPRSAPPMVGGRAAALRATMGARQATAAA